MLRLLHCGPWPGSRSCTKGREWGDAGSDCAWWVRIWMAEEVLQVDGQLTS